MKDRQSNFTMYFPIAARLLLTGLMGMLMLASTPVLFGQTYSETVLYSFGAASGASDGEGPTGKLLRDNKGNLYGATYFGGVSFNGTVFVVNSAGKQHVMYSFMGTPDGQNPSSALIPDAAGNLYGTAYAGGAHGYGAVFRVNHSTRQATLVYSFSGGADGSYPEAGLIRDSAGNFYGTTVTGGTYGAGTIFKIDSLGTETVLHSFNGLDGGNPEGTLLRDANGNLYGTASSGIGGHGVVFKLAPSGTLIVLYQFTGTPDGSEPFGSLTADGAGNLYGTTAWGGTYDLGTVFKLALSTRQLTVLHSFSGAADGQTPLAGLLLDSSGNLFGTAMEGGLFGWGTVFKLDSAGHFSVLHNFAGSPDGAYPSYGSDLVSDAAGVLYGTTVGGGIYGDGTVYKLMPN